MAQREEFMFQNVAYSPTVYKTGIRATTEPHRQKFKMTTDYWSGTQNVFGIFIIKVCTYYSILATEVMRFIHTFI